ncbi:MULTISPECIES: ABC transporter-like protein [Streptomyces]|uniref:Uncharacterized protein n=1 Tax=Streptomyces sudanensis TaxID=436397 RepID=A0ABY4TEQ1_9ACTN|nr:MULTISPECIES: ABC transporter-like protein [Streptomyces]URN17212.1 hypothetical protein MW084_16235 [Streptomyces sudanensis]
MRRRDRRPAGPVAPAAEVMLLDGPANRLDETALGRLEDSLRTHRGALGAVSHDRLLRRRPTGHVRRPEAGRPVRRARLEGTAAG